jgi:hypothetical protein
MLGKSLRLKVKLDRNLGKQVFVSAKQTRIVLF